MHASDLHISKPEQAHTLDPQQGKMAWLPGRSARACRQVSTPPASANSAQISSLTARRLTAPHTAAATSGPAMASPPRCRMASSAPGAPALASMRPFWKALSSSDDCVAEAYRLGLIFYRMTGAPGAPALASMRSFRMASSFKQAHDLPGIIYSGWPAAEPAHIMVSKKGWELNRNMGGSGHIYGVPALASTYHKVIFLAYAD